ncbi:MAG: ACP S-malonyltransferase [Verrucomicrobia bacterium]|jgi:malonyl CoA-acyl carrier protein transacylase|nr:ACP S-malonyltransferase [Verrucomicrobiota bacterium]MBT5479959.1 ACP S-malonyltransferase [Verrucomicrobiota bacterium]MBT6239612.1 ACP S-malonyltransferase [Verrucomicrobiota bacterium]MBT6805922.1 ACP S-malonyltransferase [Verrucomicrobiota bacterium]
MHVFPGQGSQKKGMGEGLFEQFPDITAAANKVLGYSVQSLCLEDSDEQLNLTQFTQPALYTVNALTYLKNKQDTKRQPDFMAGHSLGEYNALLAAGVFDFETGLTLVQKRGALMAEAKGGGMAAVLGMDIQQIREVIQNSGSKEVSVANLNAPQQTVLTGSKEGILEIKSAFESAGAKRYIPLNVSGAFHSPFMEPARKEFKTFLKSFTFGSPTIPVISNVEATPYPRDGVAELLAQQITSPVRWVETIQYLKKQSDPAFEEMGPGKVLRGLIRQIS